MTTGSAPVASIMQTEIAVVKPEERLDLVDDVMRLGRVRHMPVVEAGRLVGVVSSQDLLAVSLARAFSIEESQRRAILRSLAIRDVMSRDVVTLRGDATIQEAAELLVKHKIGCLPIVGPDDVLLGLVTQTDVLLAMLPPGSESDARASRARGKAGMADIANRFDRELGELKRIRDELRVRMHLARAEVADLWDAAEHKFAKLDSHVKRVAKQAEEPLEDAGAAARLLVDELREVYRRIKAAL